MLMSSSGNVLPVISDFCYVTDMSIIPRVEGYNMRLDMMKEHLLALPQELLSKILGILGANEAATRIQAAVRRYQRYWQLIWRRGIRYEIDEDGRHVPILPRGWGRTGNF